MLKGRKDQVTTTPREHLGMLENTISELRADVEKFHQDVQIAQLRFRSAEQQLAEIASQQSCLGTSDSTQQNSTYPSLRLGQLDSDSTAFIHEDFTLSRDHQKTSSTVSPVTGIPDSVQLSNVMSKEEEIRAEENDTTKRQPIPVVEAIVSDRVIADNDIQTTDAPSHPCPDGATGNGEASGLLHSPRTDVKDASMTDVEDLVDTCSGSASKVHSKGRSTRGRRKSPLPAHQACTTKKTRSARTLDQPFSSKVLKHAAKKHTRNAKASTKKETKAIMSAISLEESPTKSPPLRRSQRLEEKAATSLCAAAP